MRLCWLIGICGSQLVLCKDCDFGMLLRVETTNALCIKVESLWRKWIELDTKRQCFLAEPVHVLFIFHCWWRCSSAVVARYLCSKLRLLFSHWNGFSRFRFWMSNVHHKWQSKEESSSWRPWLIVYLPRHTLSYLPYIPYLILICLALFV